MSKFRVIGKTIRQDGSVEVELAQQTNQLVGSNAVYLPSFKIVVGKEHKLNSKQEYREIVGKDPGQGSYIYGEAKYRDRLEHDLDDSDVWSMLADFSLRLKALESK